MVIRLRDRTQDSCHLQPLRVKIDPGSKTTGLALVRESESIDFQSGQIKRRATVLLLMELAHRGRQISEALTARRNMRRRRRGNLPAALQTGPWKKAGRYVGRVAVRASGFFNIQGSEGIIQGISHRHCRLIQRNDGYGYHYAQATFSDPVASAKNPKCTDASHPPLYLPGLKAEVSREEV
jgi:RRXRR protein